MKKLLLGSAAVGLVLSAAPAYAQVELDLGGYFKGYGVFQDQDDLANTESNEFDFIRETEVHFGGETTLDNGLTVGVHIEAETDGNEGFDVDESYVYFSGGWGRVNFGDEDGAAYLLQVEAPSADSNYDGLRQYVQPINYATLTPVTGINTGGFDYEQAVSGKATKLTYLTPIFSGFQAGVSYTPDEGAAGELAGVGRDDDVNAFSDIVDLAVRYEGQFQNVGVIVGGGYTWAELEAENSPLAAGNPQDDREAWNVGIDLDIGPFGIGAAYLEDDQGERFINATTNLDDQETYVVGVDYTTGPFKLGASYYDSENVGTTTVDGLETDRYTGGVTYTYGPGMTFRGSVSYIEHEATGIGGAGVNDVEATSVLLGTQINF